MAQLRPGAMTAAMSAVRVEGSHETWLRVGVVRGGAIVEERWVRPGKSLGWGRSERADVVIAGAPHDRAELVRAVGGGWEIGVGLRGRASCGGEAIDLATLRAPLAIAEGSRARIELGGVIVLVDARMRPPERAAATLPGSARSALGFDERFTTIALASLCFHAALILIAGEIDAPYVSTVERVRTAIPIFPEDSMPPDAPPPDDGGEVARNEDDAESPQSPTSPVTPSRPSHATPRRGPSAGEVRLAQQEAIAQAERLLIGSLGAEGGSAIDDLIRGGTRTMSEAEVLGQVSADGHASLGPAWGNGEPPRDSSIDIADPVRPILTTTQVGPAQEGDAPAQEAPVSIATPEPPEVTQGGDLPPDVLGRELRARRRRVQACYERALRDEPDLAGRVLVEMTVERTGTLSRVRIGSGSIGSDPFHSCVVHAFDGFRTTAPPEGGAADVSFPFVFARQD